MKRHTRAGRELLACILSMSLILPGTALAVTSQDVKDAKNQAVSIEEEKKKAEQTLAGLESLKADTAAYVKQLDASLEQTAQEISNLQSQIETKEGECGYRKRTGSSKADGRRAVQSDEAADSVYVRKREIPTILICCLRQKAFPIC